MSNFHLNYALFFSWRKFYWISLVKVLPNVTYNIVSIRIPEQIVKAQSLAFGSASPGQLRGTRAQALPVTRGLTSSAAIYLVSRTAELFHFVVEF